MNRLENIGCDRFGENFIGPLKRVDAVDQINIELVDVDQLFGHPYELGVSLGSNLDRRALEDAIGDDGLTYFLNLLRRQVGILPLDDLGDEDLIDHFGSVFFRIHGCPQHGLVLENGGRQIVQVAFKNLACARSRRLSKTANGDDVIFPRVDDIRFSA